MHPLDRGAVPIHRVRQIARIIRNRGQTAVHGRSRQPARPAQARVDLGRHIPSGGDPQANLVPRKTEHPQTCGALVDIRLVHGQNDFRVFLRAVEGVFVQQMVEHGHLLFPVENGIAPMYKPPLFHWTALAIDRLAAVRKVTAANLRLPSALYAVAGAVLTMLFAYEFLGIDAAVLAGLALAASYQYVSQGRYGRGDRSGEHT